MPARNGVFANERTSRLSHQLHHILIPNKVYFDLWSRRVPASGRCSSFIHCTEPMLVLVIDDIFPKPLASALRIWKTVVADLSSLGTSVLHFSFVFSLPENRARRLLIIPRTFSLRI